MNENPWAALGRACLVGKPAPIIAVLDHLEQRAEGFDELADGINMATFQPSGNMGGNCTALFVASRSPHPAPAAVEALLERGACPNRPSDFCRAIMFQFECHISQLRHRCS